MNYIDRNEIAYKMFLSQPYATEVCDGRSWRHKLKCQSLFVIKRNSLAFIRAIPDFLNSVIKKRELFILQRNCNCL